MYTHYTLVLCMLYTIKKLITNKAVYRTPNEFSPYIHFENAFPLRLFYQVSNAVSFWCSLVRRGSTILYEFVYSNGIVLVFSFYFLFFGLALSRSGLTVAPSIRLRRSLDFVIPELLAPFHNYGPFDNFGRFVYAYDSLL